MSGRQKLVMAALAAGLCLSMAGQGRADWLRSTVDAIAGGTVAEGSAVGVGVAIIAGDQPTRFFTYGQAVAGADGDLPFRRDTIFELGSVTKIFTTNLLAQMVADGEVRFGTPLSSFAAQIGRTHLQTGQVTLGQLATFTGGFPTLAPECRNGRLPAVTGCLPSERPTISDYGASDYAAYFRTTLPRDLQQSGPVATLPAPYFYSDFSTGLLGLLLGQVPKTTPLDRKSLLRWENKVRTRLLEPLGMKDTALDVPATEEDRRALGYNRAIASATVSGGKIAGLALDSGGGNYQAAPEVTITGGGGTGAAASVTVKNRRVAKIKLESGGSGYLAPAKIVLSDGGSTTEAVARAIVRNGRVVAVRVESGGAGYKRAPTVTISGGTTGTQAATATAYIANGAISYVEVLDGGAGYVEPLSVSIAPPPGVTNTVPIWAPAGALKSTLTDMARLARAALGQRTLDNGRPVPAAVTAAFDIAERAYACEGSELALGTCPAGASLSGLAWTISPRDAANGVPHIVAKDGGLTGFSTEVMLMPARDLAVVVFVNTREEVAKTGKPTGLASMIARNLLFAQFYESL